MQSLEAKINTALDHWLATVVKEGGESIPWSSAQEMYNTIDAIREGDASWQTIKVKYTGPLPSDGPTPRWMHEEYELCFRDLQELLHEQMASSEFDGHFDYVPYKEFDRKGDRTWSNLMSGDWAWTQSVHSFHLPCKFLTYFARI